MQEAGVKEFFLRRNLLRVENTTRRDRPTRDRKSPLFTLSLRGGCLCAVGITLALAACPPAATIALRADSTARPAVWVGR